MARLLVVDDDHAFRVSTAALLRVDGHEVDVAPDANAAAQALRGRNYDLLLLDLRMQLTSGLQFLRAIRAIEGLATTPVAIVTGDYGLDDEVRDEIRALGAELRFKPIWIEELVTLARELLRVPVKP